MIFQKHSRLRHLAFTKSTSHRGISLVIVMIFLVILSVLGISAMQGSTLSSRIARNEADRNLAFQAAEAALRDAELDLRNIRWDQTDCVPGALRCRERQNDGYEGFNASCTDGRCTRAATGSTPVWEIASRWETTGASVAYGSYSGASDLPLVSRQPRYLLEASDVTAFTIYRVTAVGFGTSSSSQVMLQSMVIIGRQKRAS